MDKKKDIKDSIGLMLPVLLCEMLSLCTSEERRDLLKGLSKSTNRSTLGALFNALCKGSEPTGDKRWVALMTAALMVPACVIVNKILSNKVAE